jgi:hypothetical protein
LPLVSTNTGSIFLIARAIRISAWGLVGLTSALTASSADLQYDGLIAGFKAGSARVHIESEGDRYAIRGHVSTTGFWDLVIPWDARFAVLGRIEYGRAESTFLLVRENDWQKDRTIRVADGILREVRNGKMREELPAPRGVDLMSALWVTAKCDDKQVLNNGRDHYTMTLQARTSYDDGAERCDYEIVDDDGGKWKGWIRLGTWHGKRVPEKIVMNDGIEVGLELVKASWFPSDTGDGAFSAELEGDISTTP